MVCTRGDEEERFGDRGASAALAVATRMLAQSQTVLRADQSQQLRCHLSDAAKRQNHRRRASATNHPQQERPDPKVRAYRKRRPRQGKVNFRQAKVPTGPLI